ncbi:MAG: hypothetical protein N3H31_07445 [Candidatus Nezhaarchaeota archaeon]|nr:hypothetical protein [Candidatus Nezhaarchaeota archaeon]
MPKGLPVRSPWCFEAMAKEAKEGSFCAVRGVFGSTELMSHVRIYDAWQGDLGRA